ncbi:thioredoxin [Candidatus Albibeggiatoa sp. nov. NOAA]|uniref:thioredoxin n=1 Tax=Candidatus Albibeggiatoa sp. nov. NOAA TaxID=3162724 RepID=UPI0032F7626A|nr:thioredoxin [Thiotrichaceae bacterium]
MATVELTKENFQSYVEGNNLLIIDFWAPWCGPCRSFAPTYETVSEQHEDVVFAKVNTEEQQELAGMFSIRSIPTLMIFKEQVIVFSQAGSLPESALQEVIGKAKDLDMDVVRAEMAKEEQQSA